VADRPTSQAAPEIYFVGSEARGAVVKMDRLELRMADAARDSDVLALDEEEYAVIVGNAKFLECFVL
jgi:hypothetical protein